MKTAVIRYIDIDAASWKWGDIRHTSPKDSVESAIESITGEEGAALIVGRSAGNMKYDGYHGLYSAADVICAAGLLPGNGPLVCLRNDIDGWEAAVDMLVEAGCHPVFTGDYVPQGTQCERTLELGIDPSKAPPKISLSGCRFPKDGMRRLSNAAIWHLSKSFSNTSGMTLTLPCRGLIEALSGGFVSGWWDDYEPVNRFGAWVLAKSEIDLDFDEGQLREACQQMEEIGQLWETAAKSDPLAKITAETSPKEIAQIMRKTTVSDMLVAYASGVPLEDIIA